MSGLRIHNPSPGDYEIRACIALSTNNEAMYVGQAVDIEGAANTTVVRSGGSEYQPGTLPSIKAVTSGATNVILGVIVGFDPTTDGSVSLHRAASTARVVHVLVPKHSGVVFELEDDASGSPAAGMVGANANLVGNDTGSTVTGLSDVKFDATTPAADATYQLKVVGLRAGFAGNAQDALADGCIWLVKINLLREANAIVGV